MKDMLLQIKGLMTDNPQVKNILASKKLDYYDISL